MKKITWKNNTGFNLAEEFSGGLQFSACSEDGKQCCPWVHCKDFLHDMIYGTVHKKNVSVYGFTHGTKSIQPDLTKIKLLIANRDDKKLRDKIESLADFIHQVEEILDIEKTAIEECSEPAAKFRHGGVWHIEGDNRWLNSPPMLSMYALLIRVGLSHTKGDNFKKTIDGILKSKIRPYQPIDCERLGESKKGIEYILKHGDRAIFYPNIKDNYPKKVETYDLHENYGIIGFTNKNCDVEYWHRSLKKSKVNTHGCGR